MSQRLIAFLQQLPFLPSTGRLLSVGCGAFDEASALRKVFPHWHCIGVDIDPLARATLRADGCRLPFARKPLFDLILVRHPDVALRGAAWQTILSELPRFLMPAAWLVVSTYSADEVQRLRQIAPFLQMASTANLPAINLLGQERHMLTYQGQL